MTWMRMPGQTWPGAAATFVGTWFVMMAAMMLPSLVAALRPYRRAIARSGATGLASSTVIVSAAYLLVWTALGAGIFPLGVAVAAAAIAHPKLARAVPIAAGVVVVLAGLVQLTAWKARQLDCCRQEPRGRALRGDARAAWRYGLRLALHCVQCCASLTAVLLVLGIMDLRAMTIVAAATTLERVVPAGKRAARAIGMLLLLAGLLSIARVVSCPAGLQHNARRACLTGACARQTPVERCALRSPRP